MSKVMAGVDQRTQLVGHNRLELLLFRLGRRQRFGINVFKVKEVIQCPPLTNVPHSHPVVRGISNMRGQTITVIDLAQAVGRTPIEDLSTCSVIITEYNRSVQGFLVSGVDRIVNLNWEEVLPPPKGTGSSSYLTAVTNVDSELVEIIDVEKVLAEVTGMSTDVSDSVLEDKFDLSRHILVVDDSVVARKQICRTLDQCGVEYTTANNGREALDQLETWAEDETLPVTERLAMVISDVEMPEMDGYTLTKSIKADPRLENLYVMLHTSLSGVFNQQMVQNVGADAFMAKYTPDQLAEAVLKRIAEFGEQSAAA